MASTAGRATWARVTASEMKSIRGLLAEEVDCSTLLDGFVAVMIFMPQNVLPCVLVAVASQVLALAISSNHW